MDIRTHLGLDPELCGTPEAIGEGTASVSLMPTRRMQADASGLVHGGFVFGLADFTAMLAINEPTVVVGAAELRFAAPAVVGERLVATARRDPPAGPPAGSPKHMVDVEVRMGETVVLTGRLTCFVPARHVLESKR